MVYACSVAATTQGSEGLVFRHSVFLVEARSRDEALGKALRIVLKGYPIGKGYYDHNVSVTRDDETPMDPDKPISFTEAD